MNEKSIDTMRVTLDIGDVAMPAEELLQMRPGNCYQFSINQPFQATLRINGEPWALADVIVNDTVAQFSVRSLCIEAAPTVSTEETSDHKKTCC